MDIKTLLSVFAILISVITFVVSFLHTWRTSVAAKRPVLVFVYDQEKGWIVRNIGNGPALNVVIAQRHIDDDWFNPVRVPPFSKDSEFGLNWIGHSNISYLGATYSDFDGRTYTSICGNDLSQAFRGARFGPWKEDRIGRHWNQLSYKE